MIVHATAEQLAAEPWNLTPTNATALLRSASLLVDRALLAAVYDTDSAGAPTDSGVSQALTEATCAQVATWVALGIDPVAGPAGATAGQVVSKTIGSARIEYDRGTSTGQSATGSARQAAANTLTDDAVQILATAGLLTTRVWTYG